MTRAALLLGLGLAACGDDVRFPDAAPPGPACRAAFTGDFAETDETIAPCASLAPDGAGGWSLALTVPSATIGEPLAISIDLGPAPAIGTSSSGASAAAWSAFAYRRIGEGGCVFRAGSAVAPPGSFTLALTTADPEARAAHGTLDLAMRVLTTPGTDCGDPDTESLSLAF